MKMVIEKIIIEKNQKLMAEYDFTETLTKVPCCAELYDVIKVVFGLCEPIRSFHNLRFLARVTLDQPYYIRGRKNKGDRNFEVSVHKENEETECSERYFESVLQNKELDSSLFFHRFKRQDYPHKLFKYKDLLKHYPDGEFARLTNGYGLTRSFRGFVTNYIKHFKPVRISRDRNLYLDLLETGEFTVEDSNGKNVKLNEQDNFIYHCLSFLSIADFWNRAEKIRNLNRVNKPLLISFYGLNYEKEVFSEIKEHLKKAGRQVILFSDI